MKRKRVIICGGHLTPAVAVMQKLKGKADLIFVGRREAISGSENSGEEERAVSEMGVKFINLNAGRRPRELNWAGITSFLKIPWGLVGAFLICLQVRPDVIVSFGGYIGLPMVIAGGFLGIPIVIQEQTHGVGLANRVSAVLAKKICVSFPSSRRYYPANKTIVTGLPLREEIFNPQPEMPMYFSTELARQPILYIIGGATGARSMNKLIYEIVPELVKQFVVVHQVGRMNIDTAPVKERYIPRGYLEIQEHAYFIQKAVMVVSRAGANSVGEIGALGKTGLLMPLPWAAGGEQQVNAEFLEDMGSVIVVDQEKITGAQLLAQLHKLYTSLAKYRNTADNVKKKWIKNAASLVASEILSL